MAPSPSLSSYWAHFRPPKPGFTERDIPDLRGKVYIVSGSSTGIGKEVAHTLYAKNAKVYIAARSEDKAKKAIEDIQEAVPTSKGALIFLYLDLSNLDNVKAAAGDFLSHEEKLHALFNNAGVMVGSTEPIPQTVQGYELSLGVNCIGTLLFTKLLTPALAATAKSEPPDTVRVIWLSSFGMEMFAHKDVGVSLENLDYHVPKPATERYGISKAGVWALGVEFAKQHKADGIVSVPLDPGNVTSELARDQPVTLKLVAKVVCYSATLGACTELFAGFSPEVTMARSGEWVIPFGRYYPLREDLPKATKARSEGGTGGTADFWKWTEDQIKEYL